jgi:long-chain acyl-CoA synthetase
MAAMGQKWVEMKTRRVETGWFYAAPAVLNSLNDRETRNNFKDSWYYTNDMFFQDKDGFFYFSGRRNGMMKVAGLKVFPVELEDLLIQHPAIREVCVVRSEDPIHGEIPKAIVVLEQGTDLTLKELREYCTPRLATYKIPKRLEFRSSLPRNPVGKILVHQL